MDYQLSIGPQSPLVTAVSISIVLLPDASATCCPTTISDKERFEVTWASIHILSTGLLQCCTSRNSRQNGRNCQLAPLVWCLGARRRWHHNSNTLRRLHLLLVQWRININQSINKTLIKTLTKRKVYKVTVR